MIPASQLGVSGSTQFTLTKEEREAVAAFLLLSFPFNTVRIESSLLEQTENVPSTVFSKTTSEVN